MRWLALGLAALAGCSSKSNLQVSWSFSGLAGPPSAAECSQRGVTAVLVQAVEANVTVIEPCAGGKVTIALEPRAYTVNVIGLDPGGHPRFDPRPDEGTLPAGLTHTAYSSAQASRAPGSIAVTFRTLPKCANGVDDDSPPNGATDLNDPSCCSSLDDTEGTPRATPCPTDGGSPADGGTSSDGPRDASPDSARRDASPDSARRDAGPDSAARDAGPRDASAAG